MTENMGKSKLDRRVQRTYQQLAGALLRLLTRKPWQQITVQELCDEAVIRRTTFYQHFQDKQDFVNWFLEEKRLEFSAWIADDDPPRKLGDHFVSLATRVLDYLKRHEEVEMVVENSGERGARMLEGFLRTCVGEMVSRLSARGDLQQDGVTPAITLLSEFYVGGLLAALRWWFTNGKPCTEEELIRYLRRIVERSTFS